jgi:hypothetical protein
MGGRNWIIRSWIVKENQMNRRSTGSKADSLGKNNNKTETKQRKREGTGACEMFSTVDELGKC